MPAVPEPRGPGPDQALPTGPAHGRVAPPLPGVSHPQRAHGRRATDGGGQGARAAAGSAEETGGEGEGSHRGAQAEEEGYSHPAVDAHAKTHQRPQGTSDMLNARWGKTLGYHLHLPSVFKQTARFIAPTPLTPPPQGPCSVIVPQIFSQLWLCESRMEGKEAAQLKPH